MSIANAAHCSMMGGRKAPELLTWLRGDGSSYILLDFGMTSTANVVQLEVAAATYSKNAICGAIALGSSSITAADDSMQFAMNGNRDRQFWVGYHNGGWCWNSSNGILWSSSASNPVFHTFEISRFNQYPVIVKYDGTTKTMQGGNATNSTVYTGNWGIFCLQEAGGNAKYVNNNFFLKAVRILNNGIAVHDIRPAKVDTAIGVVDLATSKFYAGVGNFTYL